MPAGSAISKIGKVEFFAVMPSGFYVLNIAFILLYEEAWTQPADSLWDHISPLADLTKENPVILIFILFGSYLLGSILRAIPVGWSERVSKLGVPSKFPYQARLETVRTHLENTGCFYTQDTCDLFIQGDTDSIHSVFNHWKDILCVNCPEAFDYYRAFEARTRFFSNMFLAGLTGLIGALIMIGRTDNLRYGPAWYLLGISLIIIVPFGLQLKRVRLQEVKVLQSLMIAWNHKAQQYKRGSWQ